MPLSQIHHKFLQGKEIVSPQLASPHVASASVCDWESQVTLVSFPTMYLEEFTLLVLVQFCNNSSVSVNSFSMAAAEWDRQVQLCSTKFLPLGQCANIPE